MVPEHDHVYVRSLFSPISRLFMYVILILSPPTATQQLLRIRRGGGLY